MIVLWFGDDLGVDLRTASRHDQAALVGMNGPEGAHEASIFVDIDSPWLVCLLLALCGDLRSKRDFWLISKRRASGRAGAVVGRTVGVSRG